MWLGSNSWQGAVIFAIGTLFVVAMIAAQKANADEGNAFAPVEVTQTWNVPAGTDPSEYWEHHPDVVIVGCQELTAEYGIELTVPEHVTSWVLCEAWMMNQGAY